MHDAQLSILLIHGAGGGGWEWRPWIEVLRACGHRCDAPDCQPVAAGLAGTGLQDYLAQMRAALRALPAPRAVVGASLGGLLAAMLASEADADVDALVLVNALPPAPWHAQLPSRQWPEVVRWHADARLGGSMEAMADADPASILWAFRHWRDESGRAMREAMAGVVVAVPPARTLVLAGTADTDVPAQAGIGWAHTWGADLERIVGAGHLSPLVGPQAAGCAERVARWLSAG